MPELLKQSYYCYNIIIITAENIINLYTRCNNNRINTEDEDEMYYHKAAELEWAIILYPYISYVRKFVRKGNKAL